jgi:integrase
MPRRRSPPRLYLDRIRKQWLIRDGALGIRTGCPETNRVGAEKRLAEYLASKHKPEPSADPLIADFLLAYSNEHLAATRSAKNGAYNIANLSKWWGDKKLSDVIAANCRAYAKTKKPAAARRDLEMLRAAINHWHREYGPLPVIPAVVLPDKPEARERWMTRSEAAKLLWHARRTPHLARFILLGLYTGSRSGVLLRLEWSWIDLKHGLMARRAAGSSEAKNKRTPKVKLGRRILAHLKRWHRLDGKHRQFVCHYDGQQITKLRRSFPTAAKYAKLKNVTPHVLRHSRATWLMQKGVDPWKAAGHLGMSVETLLRVYGHHHPDYQKEAAEV